ncbi:porphobilinogen synthase [Candidatus Sumerlaeota bacterium]|nr:porphobilinogen synthase [Candidatus Sumerlaeota bacterium]
MPEFPLRRLRRLRRTEPLRAMMRENRVELDELIAPMFVAPGRGVKREVSSMPGVFNLSVDRAVDEARALAELGVRAAILFGIPETKDEEGSGAWADDGIIQQAARAIKQAVPDLVLIADCCLCEYTSHGHCGPVAGGEIANDPALALLQRTAISQAAAGCDVIAPSGMMDGMVHAIRSALDAENFQQVPILSYAVKYASAFYGPFREAAASAPSFGDRRSHQLDPANYREALLEAETDVAEGADALMVKPGMPCLDLVRALRDRFDLPLAVYQVSGEYAMIHAAARNGWLELERCALESLMGFKRAGADMIISYFTRFFAEQQQRQS